MNYSYIILLCSFGTVLAQYEMTLEEAEDVIPEGRHNRRCICPSTTISEDLSDPADLKSVRRQLVYKFWNMTTPTLTANGRKMREQIYVLLKSDVKNWNYNAYVMTVMTWNLLPYADMMPSLCDSIALINAAVDWEKTMNGASTQTALNNLITSVHNSTLSDRSSLLVAGCNVAAPSVSKGSCDLLSAMVDEIWELKGNWLPCSYKKLAKEMFKSGNYSDVIMAISATATLTAAAEIMDDNLFNQNLLIMRQRLMTSGLIPSCCCGARAALLAALRLQIREEMQRVVDIVSARYPKKP